VKGLWDSWADDTFPQDKATGRFLDPAKVQVLGHKGKHFKVAGPLNAPRPPQGHPVVFSAGQSEAGRELSAQVDDDSGRLQDVLEEGPEVASAVELDERDRDRRDLRHVDASDRPATQNRKQIRILLNLLIQR
jgi:alkanesulfonate monooxygenase SsuD/methylene tetrahydromethanopterin reductase-like flavin-dependent oxidoreductase (luciferase family)